MKIDTNGKGVLIELGKAIIPNFNIADKNLQENYKKLFYYFTRSEKCKEYDIDPNKSLWIYGEIGSGKSIAMKVFQDFCFYTSHLGNRKLSIFRYKKIEDDFDEFKTKIFDDYGYEAKKDLCFDEFLKSSGVVNNFGKKQNLAEMLLDDRYESYINHGYKTHIISNISPIYVKEHKILDERILDRCRQMYNIISWDGETKRMV